MSKVAIIGAGNVGGLAASWIAGLDLADVVLLDKGSGKAKGKAMDINDALYILGSSRWVEGGSDYDMLSGCEVIVVTAGVARKPGMSREDLLRLNLDITSSILAEARKRVSDSVVWIFVTNPVDIITTYAYRFLGIDRHKIIGMGVNLDSSRMINQIADRYKLDRNSITAMVIGRHGKGMLPLVDSVSVSGLNFPMSSEDKKYIAEKTINRGAEIVSALTVGSAYVAPGAGIYQVVKAILGDTNQLLPLSVPLEGEYGLENVAIGVPVKVGRSGWKEILEIDLTDDLLSSLKKAGQEIDSYL